MFDRPIDDRTPVGASSDNNHCPSHRSCTGHVRRHGDGDTPKSCHPTVTLLRQRLPMMSAKWNLIRRDTRRYLLLARVPAMCESVSDVPCAMYPLLLPLCRCRRRVRRRCVRSCDRNRYQNRKHASERVRRVNVNVSAAPRCRR